MSADMRIKHDPGLRSLAASLFERGLGSKSVAHALCIPEEAVRNWQATFRSVGLEGLLRMGSSQRKYDWGTKCAAARAVAEGGMTLPEAMTRYGVASKTPLKNWVRAYREGGEEALRPRPKGRPAGPSSKAAPKTREQELEERVRKLEAQVAYLKNRSP